MIVTLTPQDLKRIVTCLKARIAGKDKVLYFLRQYHKGSSGELAARLIDAEQEFEELKLLYNVLKFQVPTQYEDTFDGST